MVLFRKLLPVVGIVAAILAHQAVATPRTVCTITVNSPDEREMFRRSLPTDRYRFVELVERGRSDWLASACHKGIRCDVLLISGHFDGGDEFYSDRVDASESLPVDELERASCSDACPGLFSQLKEVYLFGCNTLNADTMHPTSAEAVRSLVRAGYAVADAEALSRLLIARHADSNRDRMRQIFKDVPVIYGFSSKAPLGASAAPILERYFQSGAAPAIGSGVASGKLLALFAPASMTVASGVTGADPQADDRRDMCEFTGDRESAAHRIEFVHALLGRDMAVVRMFLDPIEKLVGSLSPSERRDPAVARALDAIASDSAAKAHWLVFARDADEPATRARMIGLAERMGWLSRAESVGELVSLFRERLAHKNVDAADVELACTLNAENALDHAANELASGVGAGSDARATALLACLGNRDARARTIDALTSRHEADVRLAQVYLRHHPLAGADELRSVALRVVRMSDTDTQILALDTLAEHRVSDRASLEALTRLFPLARSVNVQRAIAAILIRSDYDAIAKPELVRALRDKRLKSPDGKDLIDVLIRRMQAALGRPA